MRNLLLFILLFIDGKALAQSDIIINTVTLCITEGKYNDAEKFLDSLLRVEPKNIDALMMKGNVLLNYAIMQAPPMNTITPDDESVYSQDLASLKTPTVLIPKDEALKVDKLWRQCIGIDSGRLDIRQGICTLYGMADMKKELLDYLPVITSAGKVKGKDFVYALMQYAQLLQDRGDKQGAYEAYKKIATLYPGISSVWCQLATAYRANGDMANARLYADRAFAAPPDMSACGDALDIYAVLGEYTKVLPALKTISRDSLYPVYSFYDGIYRYAHHDTTWRGQLANYVKQFPTPPDSDILYTAASYMLAPQFRDDYHDFIRLLTFANSDFYTGLVIDKAVHDFKDSIQPYLEQAKLMVDGHNYPKANAIYASIENKKMDAELQTVYQMEYGFSLYCAGEYAKAINRFSKITDPAFMVIADYFIAQSYLKSGNKPKALIYFKAILDSKDESKYSYLSKLAVEKIVKK
jgi:tetratricopeptide (TPR) repeat protein